MVISIILTFMKLLPVFRKPCSDANSFTSNTSTPSLLDDFENDDLDEIAQSQNKEGKVEEKLDRPPVLVSPKSNSEPIVSLKEPSNTDPFSLKKIIEEIGHGHKPENIHS